MPDDPVRSLKRALWRWFGPRNPRVKAALWNLLRLHRIPSRPGVVFEIRERLGRTERRNSGAQPYFSQGGQDRFLNEVIFRESKAASLPRSGPTTASL